MKADVKFDEQRRSPRRTAFVQASIVQLRKTEHLSIEHRVMELSRFLTQ